jgi:hypothetical protein
VIEKRRTELGEELLVGKITRTGKLKFQKSSDLVTKKLGEANPWKSELEINPFADLKSHKRSRDSFDEIDVPTVDIDSLVNEDEAARKRQRVC